MSVKMVVMGVVGMVMCSIFLMLTINLWYHSPPDNEAGAITVVIFLCVMWVGSMGMAVYPIVWSMCQRQRLADTATDDEDE
jgi:hypothetical protein